MVAWGEHVSEPIDIPIPQTSEAFGPDHTRSTEDVVKEKLAADGINPPKTAERNPPRRARGLGQNVNRNSGVRQLTKDDRDKIAALYTFGAAGIMPFRMKTAQAMAESAETCADAWVDLAKKNDSVRRVLLMLIEGGAIGALFAAHLPIIMTLLPETALSGMFKGMDFTPPNESDSN
jgi:hypothetical protein